MDFAELKREVHLYVKDPILQQYYGDWVNNAIAELALDFDFPALKLHVPATVSCYASAYYVDLPSNFQKKLFRVWDKNKDDVYIHRDTINIHDIDEDHDVSASPISDVAVFPKYGAEDTWQIMYYPRATETLQIWYYREPPALSAETETPHWIPSPYHRRVIVPKAIIRGYQLLGDMVIDPPHTSLQYWEGKLQEGLYGRPGGEVGLLNWFNSAVRPPKRYGGRQALP
jgi:hypothetical protein